MDSSPPTTGDFAWAAAESAQRQAAAAQAENGELHERIEILEQDVQILTTSIRSLLRLLSPGPQTTEVALALPGLRDLDQVLTSRITPEQREMRRQVRNRRNGA